MDDSELAVRVMIDGDTIAKRIKTLGCAISTYYKDSQQELVLVGLLRGSVVFMADLCRQIECPHELDFMTVSSYGDNTVGGDIKILKDLDSDIQGKDVLIVEDIIDSGYTLDKVIQMLATRNPASIQVCTLVSKPSRRQVAIDVRFLGFEVEDKFIVGYGLDYQQKYRHLPYIGEIGL